MEKNRTRIDFTKKFDKQLRKAPRHIQRAFRKRFEVFLDDSFADELKNHPLKGRYSGKRSINITGDWRAVYRESEQKHGQVKRGKAIIFEAIGTHSQLYR